MYEKVFQVKFQGAAFFDDTVFPIFKDEKERISVIYGKNGSGKSTFSKAVLKASGKDIPEIHNAMFLDKSGNPVILPVSADERTIYVFNEQYIQDNIRIKEEGLDTIVMLGQQVDLEEQIEKAETEKKDLETTLEKEENILGNYTDSSQVTAPRYYINRMNWALSGDDNWAGRVRIIDRDRRRNASVTDTTYQTIISNIPVKKQDEIKTEYELKLSQLRLAEDGGGKITKSARIDGIVAFDKERIISLLQTKIERPELSEREEYLLSLISSGKHEFLYQMKDFYENSTEVLCPFCRQSIQKDYKSDMAKSIKKILSKVVEEHKRDLKSAMITPISFDFTPFTNLQVELVNECRDYLTSLNQKIESINQLLQEKIDNPYQSIEAREISLRLEEILKKLMLSFENLESARKEYNRPFENIPQLKRELTDLNNGMAYYEIVNFHNLYLEQDKKLKEQQKKVNDIKVKLEKCKTLIQSLQEQKKSISIAVNLINSSLRYVFFSRDRLEIKAENDSYRLLSNGLPVRPKDVSQGERNIIALCYFFTEILNQKEEAKAYEDEMFLVIDDPISSFDRDNKIGIMSFLKEKINTIAKANKNTKIVVLSHDIQTIFDLEKIGQEVQKSATKKYGTKVWTYRISEINQRNLVDFKYKNRHEYTEMLQEVYDFAKNGGNEYVLSIGNTLRRVLESFSTFYFKMGIDEISYNQSILDMLSEACYKKYFENLMYRLVLNGESHMEERARGGSETDFCEMYSKDEKQKTAQDILSFLYLINPTHVASHLSDEDNIRTIQQWCNDIKELDL